MALILASKSPRRRELLAQMGLTDFEIHPALGEELAQPDLTPPELVQALFKLDPPEPANAQKESFGELLSQSLEDACSLPLVQKVHEQLRQNIEAHKELKSDEPLVVSRQEVSEVLSGCGVEESKLAKFNVEFDQHFGADAALSPANLIDAKKFQLKTPDVTIQVNPERTDLVQTRVIGGVKYLLICADDGVEVNGIQVDLEE